MPLYLKYAALKGQKKIKLKAKKMAIKKRLVLLIFY